MATIAIDFDGVIHRYSKGFHDGTLYDEPMEGAQDALVALLKRFSVFVFSSRDPVMVKEWFEKHIGGGIETQIISIAEDGPFWERRNILGITREKFPALAYIDDRAVRFTSWGDIKKYFL